MYKTTIVLCLVLLAHAALPEADEALPPTAAPLGLRLTPAALLNNAGWNAIAWPSRNALDKQTLIAPDTRALALPGNAIITLDQEWQLTCGAGEQVSAAMVARESATRRVNRQEGILTHSVHNVQVSTLTFIPNVFLYLFGLYF